MSKQVCEHSVIEFESKNNESKWIRMKDRLPGMNEKIFIFKNGEIETFNPKIFIDPIRIIKDHGITHWMELPDAPKESK